MPVETGNLTQLAYVPEVVFGTTPATPVGQLLRWVSADIGADRSFTKNPELRTDFMTQAGIAGGLRGKGTLSGKLSYGSYDDWLAYALGNSTWQANVVKVRPFISTGSLSLACDSAAKTWTRTVGSFVTDGFVVGDIINPAGFVNAANNAAFVVSAVSALVLTTTTATTMATEVAAVGRSITLDISPSFTLERGHKANGIYFAFPGTVVDGFELSGKSGSDATVDIKFDLLSKVVSNEAAASVFTSLTAANVNDLITSWNGSIKKAGVSILDVVGWSFKLTRNSETAEVCGSPDLYDIQPKAAMITGKLEIYFDSVANYTDFRLQNDVAFQINLGLGGTKSYTVDFTRCRITKWGAPPKEGMMTSTIEFESDVPISGTNTSLMLTRLP
jgi:hypothetical protein